MQLSSIFGAYSDIGLFGAQLVSTADNAEKVSLFCVIESVRKTAKVSDYARNSSGFRGGGEPSPPPPLPLGDGLMPSLTVLLANAEF